MIKYINRIIYSLVAALGLMLVFNLTDSYARTLYLEEQGAIALSENDYEYFISVRFYNEVPILETTIIEGERSIDLMIYEVAYIAAINEEYIVNDGLYILMHQTSGADLTDFFTVRILAGTSISEDYMGFKIFSLPLYSAITEDTQSSLIKKSLFEIDGVFQEITQIEIYQDNDLFYTVPVSIQDTNFTVKTQIEDYLSANSEAPSEAFGNVSMAPIIHINTTALVLRNIAIYAVIVIVFTILMFRARNKRLGKKDPTEGVKKDLERLETEHHKER
ncbi:MAG: hypothetical protein KKH01_05300 [Firmicutes bacterium]|nr:hypothetical protein [Bacillota bacterium]